VPLQADIFLVPLLSGAFGVGQIVICPPKTPLGTRACIFTQRYVPEAKEQSPIHISEALALILINDELLNNRTWPIVGFEALPPIHQSFKIKKAVESRFENVAIQDPAAVEAFVNALHGLYPLIHPDRIPQRAKMAADLT